LPIDFFLTPREAAADRPSSAAAEEAQGGGRGEEEEEDAPANRRFASRCRLFAIAEAESAQERNPKTPASVSAFASSAQKRDEEGINPKP
jgi:hypothetical protein